ncbi:MAG TPA: hypothetical protein DCF68_20330 [Cyanothece sp. UBA12306]|nr:hypothetical protein [Cyanothece sp. UBA12306]
MGRNKENRKKLQVQYNALQEHLEKIAKEKLKPIESQDQGLIAHWEKTVANCRQNIAKLERRLR